MFFQPPFSLALCRMPHHTQANNPLGLQEDCIPRMGNQINPNQHAIQLNRIGSNRIESTKTTATMENRISKSDCSKHRFTALQLGSVDRVSLLWGQMDRIDGWLGFSKSAFLHIAQGNQHEGVGTGRKAMPWHSAIESHSPELTHCFCICI